MATQVKDAGRMDMGPSGRNRSCRGFTLIEIMISIFILAFVLLGAVKMQTDSMRYNAMGRDLTGAINYAQQTMEMIRATPFSQVTQANFPQIDYKISVQDECKQFKLTPTITPNPATGVTQVTVTVEWTGFLFRTYTINSTISPPNF